MQRRTDHKATDYVRCLRCRRLVLRAAATQFEGAWYGPECAKRAFSNANNGMSD